MGHPSCTRNVSDDKASHCSPDGWEAPRLSMAVLHAKAGQSNVFKTSLETKGTTIKTLDEANLKALLEHIQERLEKGLTEAWLSKEGYDYESSSVFRDAKGNDQLKALPYKPAADAIKAVEELIGKTWEANKVWNDPEEQWARALAEKFVFTGYAGPGGIYGVDEPKLYQAYPKGYALMLPCQHFSTYAILSRGFSVHDVGNGLGCSAGAVKHPCFERHKISSSLNGRADWIAADTKFKANHDRDMAKYKVDKAKYDAEKNKHDDAKKAGETPPPLPPPPRMPTRPTYGYPKQDAAPAFARTEALVAADINVTPGGIVAFNPGGGGCGYQDLGVLTHVATVLRVAGSRIQFMDTGVVVGSGAASGEGGTADHSFRTGSLPHGASCVGVGALKKSADLPGATKALANARPFGLVRLAIVDTSSASKPRVRFVSKLLHMRYPVSRLMWALSGLPVENLSVLWFVYAARPPTSKHAPPQGTAWGEVLIGDTAIGTAPSSLFKDGSGVLFLTNVVRGDSGGVVVYRHKADGPKDGFNKNLAGLNPPPKPTPEMGLGYGLVIPGASSTLGSWSASWKNFDKRFTQLGSNASGTVDSSDVDVTFFKPV